MDSRNRWANRITYSIFARRLAPDEIRLEARSTGSELRLGVSRDLLTENELESITPEPDSIELEEDQLVSRGAGRRRLLAHHRCRRHHDAHRLRHRARYYAVLERNGRISIIPRE